MSSASGKCKKQQKPLNPLKSFLLPQGYMTVFKGNLLLTIANGFLKELRWYGRFTGMAWILSPEPAGKTQLPIPTVEEIILSPDFVASGLQTEHFLNCLKISVDHQKAVERLTVGQRENPAWQNLRRGRLTASNFGVILKAKRVTLSLMKRVMAEYDLS